MDSSFITYWDWILAPFYIAIISLIASRIRKGNEGNPIYRYFLLGLYARIVGAISLCLIYVYYYKSGGDTLDYHDDATKMISLLFVSAGDFMNVWLGPLTPESLFYFTNDTGFPYFISMQDPNAFGVVRLIVPLEILAMKHYLIASILMGAISFTGLWKLYTMFCELYPSLYKQLAVAILFAPSAIFWGSGILKDSWTIAAVCWFCYSFYNLVIKRRRVMANAISILVAAFVMILLKPYTFVALLPGSILWGIWNKIIVIKSVFIKIVVMPIVFGVGLSTGVGIWMLVNKSLGEYSSLESMLLKAKASSEDLKQSYYQGHSFDIGNFPPTIGGIMSKFPIATVTGLFRPFLWEAENIVMLVSAFENLLILSFTAYVLLRNPVVAFKNLFSNPLVLFCLIFSIFFAFSVGLSTSNFGALVRLRIPFFPFFLSSLVIIEYVGRKNKTIG